MKTLKIQFRHFWKNFDHDRVFGFLKNHYEFEISESPDYIVYSNFKDGRRVKKMPRLRTSAVRIFYSGENLSPSMKHCDYAFGFRHEEDVGSDRYFRLPSFTLRLWANHYTVADLFKSNVNAADVLAEKTRFCNFIYSNPHATLRIRFFKKLSKYKHIDAAGGVCNNMDGRLPPGLGNKLSFIRKHKFTIAFENASSPGYTTEKLVEPMLVRSLPIYWGNPDVARDFNPSSFISCDSRHPNLDDLVERVIEVDRNDDLYIRYMEEPYFHQDVPPPYLDRERVIGWFEKVFG